MEALYVSDESDLPLIDLSLFEGENKGEQLESHEFLKLRQAWQELGFFRVINHGISPNLIQALDAMAREMFELPAETKKRAIFPLFGTGYLPLQEDHVAKDSIPQSMFFPPDYVLPNSADKISAKLWPQGNPAFCEELNAYISHMRELSYRILKLVILSLGVDLSSKSASELFDKSHGNLRMSYYDREMISKAHTDISFLTVLYEDDLGGLQIRTKQGKWIDSKPLAGSFIFNVGDGLQMWSNGRCRSAEHRVVYGNSEKNRLSMAYFFGYKDDFVIRCPEELIDQEHPQQYKAATGGDLAAYFQKEGPKMGPMHFRL